MSGQPDFKPPPRIVDRTATKRALLTYPTCLACGQAAANGHHILAVGRGQSGDDVIENIIGLCGSGTMRCHGAFHGNPYTVQIGNWVLDVERRDREWVARRIGERLPTARPDVVAYVLGKLGREPGGAFLEATYYMPAMMSR